MPKGIQAFTNKELSRILKTAQDLGVPSIDIISKDRDAYYRINLQEIKTDKKPIKYDWGSNNSNKDLVI